MKKSLCLYFQVHQPARLRLYRFFDIGKDSHYYDDFANRTILRRVAQKCYLPMNALLLDLINENKGQFKVAFSISGTVLEQFDRYAPEVIESFRKLAATGCVEFLSETYYHSLASLASEAEFKHQVLKHKAAIEHYFGVTPTAFRNTELIYSDAIGEMVYDMGFKTMLTEGAKHVLGWKSPNFIYNCAQASGLKLLLKNSSLSDDIAFRFSDKGWQDYPLTCDKYVSWIKASAQNDEIVNLFMDYETFGEHQKAQSGIFDFMKYLPATVIADGEFEFVTPSQASKKHRPVAELDVPDPISWADEERDVTAWLGNELQNEAFTKLYQQTEKLGILNDEALWSDFGHLQESDHFYYMCTKFFSDGAVHKYFNPYDTPYEAFINYMNVLSDFILRVDDAISISDVNFAAAKEEPVKSEPVKKAAPAKKTAAKKTTVKKAAAKTAEEKPAKKAPAKKAATKTTAKKSK
ncbi:MAG: glycoside hydrolase family 57 protein [Bacteroidales bacterium]|nr:glycoside hydrolase family 57 protein [Bacteroidales bacterium]MDD5911222.1 glycoside hydrolase family 57 protein [Bacteroidales bacterium]